MRIVLKSSREKIKKAKLQEFKAEIAGRPIELKMLITMTPGKQPALVDGILAATSDIVFLVDSDTIWDPDVLRKALAPFHDPTVGGGHRPPTGVAPPHHSATDL